MPTAQIREKCLPVPLFVKLLQIPTDEFATYNEQIQNSGGAITLEEPLLYRLVQDVQYSPPTSLRFFSLFQISLGLDTTF